MKDLIIEGGLDSTLQDLGHRTGWHSLKEASFLHGWKVVLRVNAWIPVSLPLRPALRGMTIMRKGDGNAWYSIFLRTNCAV